MRGVRSHTRAGCQGLRGLPGSGEEIQGEYQRRRLIFRGGRKAEMGEADAKKPVVSDGRKKDSRIPRNPRIRRLWCGQADAQPVAYKRKGHGTNRDP